MTDKQRRAAAAVRANAPTFSLGDDGTMDTVIVCDGCGEEIRYTYDAGPDDDDPPMSDEDRYTAWISDDRYTAWIAECKVDAADDHQCA
jgi:hypothetical protein